ncbi:hypothetical protein BDZ97DRAFT_1684395 [Flammula alnicola]|nr:hypothetical protein BDZ97DRAFT_1684395 [Flammula alnicola]
MLTMLTAAQLPLTYWGEAALTAGYLYNLTVTSTLPKDITPFEVFQNRKPDVSHLKTWSVRCFAHIPLELQTKLGAKSCECLFMGYPPGGRGYRVRSLTTNHFFDSGNVIFDENIPYRALHEVSSTPVDYSALPFPILDSTTPDTSPTADDDPAAPSPPVVAPSAPVLLRAERKLTEAGRIYADTIRSVKAHLERVRTNASRRQELKDAAHKFVEERAAMLAERARMQPSVEEVAVRDPLRAQ